jgi:hypothetical protein
MGSAGFRHGPLPATLTRRIFRGDQPQELHERPRIRKACQVAPFRDRGAGHGTRHPRQGLKRLDHRGQAPRCDGLWELLFPTRQALPVCGDGPEVCLQDDVLRRGGTDDCAEPPEVGRAPGSPAGRAEIVPPQAGCQPQCRRLEVCDGLFTRPTQSTEGFSFPGGDVDGRESSRAHEAGPWHRIAVVRLHPVTSLLGEQRGGHDPADIACFAQRPGAPVAAGASFVDKTRGWAFEGRGRMRWSMSAGRVPMVPRYMTGAS